MGQKSTSKLVVTNKGGHAGFWVLPYSLKDQAINYKPSNFNDLGVAEIGPFSIYPDKFFLRKGDSIELTIKFNPSTEGKFTEKFILGCDNLKTYEYSISAESNMIELKPTSYCGKSLTPDCLPFGRVDFRDVHYLNPVTKSFEIENLTKNPITYEWKMNGRTDLFKIDPAQGMFNMREIKPFTTTYLANSFIAGYATIDLIIKDIPLESVRNPPKHILDKIKAMEEIPEEVRKNQRVEFVYFSFNLFGELLPLEYSVSPLLWQGPSVLPISQPQEAFFSIHNLAKSKATFTIDLIQSSHSHLRSKVIGVFRSKKIPEIPIDPNEGQVSLCYKGRQGKKEKIYESPSQFWSEEESPIGPTRDRPSKED